MIKEEKLMLECIKLSQNGKFNTFPNPKVGCIIEKNGIIIGKGYHKEFGGHHAEVNAINNAKKNGHSVKGASLYVNLEPCTHYGKTPPCVDLIIDEKIKSVFIGINDVNPEINGKGIKKLKSSGINVKSGILKKQCIENNSEFIYLFNSNRPYISLKIAQSLDGKIALNDYKSKWITNDSSRDYVKKLRYRYDAVLVGHNTVIHDNPSLLTYNKFNKQPKRLVLTHNAENIPVNYKIFDDKAETYLFDVKNNKNGYIKLLNGIKKINISSLLVEGGATIFSKFLEYNLWNDMYLFVAGKFVGKGISSFEKVNVKKLSESKNVDVKYLKKIGTDILMYIKNK